MKKLIGDDIMHTIGVLAAVAVVIVVVLETVTSIKGCVREHTAATATRIENINLVRDHLSQDIRVDVLTVNGKFLEDGDVIGKYVTFDTDAMVILGTRYKYGGYLWLVDLELTHAELAYYKDLKTLPVRVQFDTRRNDRHAGFTLLLQPTDRVVRVYRAGPVLFSSGIERFRQDRLDAMVERAKESLGLTDEDTSL